MPPRVVTADIEVLLGVPVLGVATVAYRPEGTTPAALRGGVYLDCLVELPAGVRDAGELHAWAFETPAGVARLQHADGTHRHEIWGHPRMTSPLTQEEADAGPRIATVTVDLGAALRGQRVREAAPLSVPARLGRFAVQALIDAADDDATSEPDGIYDAIEDHPASLRQAAAQTRQRRRQRATDTPPTWGERTEEAQDEPEERTRG